MPIFDKNKSKIKMVILLKNGNENLKETTTTGKLVNPVWYSIISKDKKPEEHIIKKMLVRFFKSKYAQQAQMLIFYDNKTKIEIERFRL